MNVSSSMISTSVAISAASSRPASSTRFRSAVTSQSRMCAASSSEKPFKRHEQERLPRQWRQTCHLLLGRAEFVDANRRPVE